MIANVGLSEPVLEKIKASFSFYPQIEKVVLFGSRAKGCFKEGSDIDLAIFGQKFSYEQLLKLDNYLDALNLPYKFDVLLYKNIDNFDLIEHINRFGIILYERI